MPDEKSPSVIVAYGIAISLGLAGLGYGLNWVIKAIAAAFGIATVIIGAGITVSSYASWLVPTASIGLAIGGVSIGILVLNKAVAEAEKHPYEWALPIIAIVSGFILDTCKELYQIDEQDPKKSAVIRIIYGASVGLFFLLGGILWNQDAVKLRFFISKIVGAIFFLIPPLLIYLRYAQLNKLSFHDASTLLLVHPGHITWSIIILLVLIILTGALAWLCSEGKLKKST